VSRRAGAEETLRELAPAVLGALVRRYGDFAACEDALQEAMLEAAGEWASAGVPERPRGWLLTVASRRLIDRFRSEEARRAREETASRLEPADATVAAAPEAELAPEEDDSLKLLFLCCHPSLSPPSQVALTLRAVGGLGTAEIARAFLVPEATIGQRISRAKKTIANSELPFAMPPPGERAARLAVVLHVLYLIFNEGYTATAGEQLQRTELCAEAIRLTRTLQRALPADPEVSGLLALMLLTYSRRDARTDGEGGLVPLAEQSRRRWDQAMIEEGSELVDAALGHGAIGAYQLQAAIAALHAQAPSAAATDWRQIAALYELLERVAPTPVVALNRAVAVAMARGPRAGLEIVAELEAAGGLGDNHRLAAVRGHILELAGEPAAARAAYREGARITTSLPERAYLERRAATVGDTEPS
jgi:RNA polymerase sigma factor (sigma-70 family)